MKLPDGVLSLEVAHFVVAVQKTGCLVLQYLLHAHSPWVCQGLSLPGSAAALEAVLLHFAVHCLEWSAVGCRRNWTQCDLYSGLEALGFHAGRISVNWAVVVGFALGLEVVLGPVQELQSLLGCCWQPASQAASQDPGLADQQVAEK